MLKLVIPLVLALAVGCGGGDSKGTTAAPAAHSGSGEQGSNAVGNVAETAAKLTAVATEAKACLDLVAAKNWQTAVPACTKAAGMDPENNQVKTALTTAQQAVANAKVADAKQAAQGAADKAAQDATKGMNDAAKGMLGGH